MLRVGLSLRFLGTIVARIKKGEIIKSVWGTVGPYQYATGEIAYAFFDDVNRTSHISLQPMKVARQWDELNRRKIFER